MKLHKLYIIVGAVLMLLLVAAGVATAKTVAPPDVVAARPRASPFPSISSTTSMVTEASPRDPRLAGWEYRLPDVGTGLLVGRDFGRRFGPVQLGTSLATGTYKTCEKLKPGWEVTHIGGNPIIPGTIGVPEVCSTGNWNANGTFNWGNHLKKVTIGVAKWEDINADGLAAGPPDVKLGGWTLSCTMPPMSWWRR